jgi:hypothetical protein
MHLLSHSVTFLALSSVSSNTTLAEAPSTPRATLTAAKLNSKKRTSAAVEDDSLPDAKVKSVRCLSPSQDSSVTHSSNQEIKIATPNQPGKKFTFSQADIFKSAINSELKEAIDELNKAKTLDAVQAGYEHLRSAHNNAHVSQIKVDSELLNHSQEIGEMKSPYVKILAKNLNDLVHALAAALKDVGDDYASYIAKKVSSDNKANAANLYKPLNEFLLMELIHKKNELMQILPDIKNNKENIFSEAYLKEIEDLVNKARRDIIKLVMVQLRKVLETVPYLVTLSSLTMFYKRLENLLQELKQYDSKIMTNLSGEEIKKIQVVAEKHLDPTTRRECTAAFILSDALKKWKRVTARGTSEEEAKDTPSLKDERGLAKEVQCCWDNLYLNYNETKKILNSRPYLIIKYKNLFAEIENVLTKFAPWPEPIPILTLPTRTNRM